MDALVVNALLSIQRISSCEVPPVHFLYIDEAGNTGLDLDNPEQPVFVMAGLIVSDERWQRTSAEVQRNIARALGGPLPDRFELHASELLGPEGRGPFVGWERNQRNRLALDLLSIIESRSHQILMHWVFKQTLAQSDLPEHNYEFNWRHPWELGFHVLLTMFEEYLRSSRTGASSTGLVIVDHGDDYLQLMRNHSRARRQTDGWMQIRKVVEIGYSVESHANTMVQLADLVAFTMKKWAECRIEFARHWPPEAHEFFRECRDRVWNRVLYKTLTFSRLRVVRDYRSFNRAIREP